MNIAEELTKLRLRSGLSRDKLAKRAGYERGTSLARYEDPEYMRGRKLPADVAAKLAHALEGLGEPPIRRVDVWRLADGGSVTLITGLAVTSVPVFPWSKLCLGGEMLKKIPRERSLDLVGLPLGDYGAADIPDDHCERVAPRGSTVVIDLADAELRDGKKYAVVLNGDLRIRRYHPNPERWESEASPPDAVIYPRETIPVIGRLVRTVKEW